MNRISRIQAYSLILIISVLFPVAQANGDYTPKTVSKLVADIDARDPGTAGRIPLILIHGFTGTSTDFFAGIDGSTTAEKANFLAFIEQFYTSNLKAHYKLYRFHYLSNELSVERIAKGLQEWVDEFIQDSHIEDVPYVLVAHSMGGLVSRSYMEEQIHGVGKYSGDPAGLRVLALITLGTPHHGSQAANGSARDAGSPAWNGLLYIIDAVFWQGVGLTDPNRSDLRWDNYNSMSGYDAADELNTWIGQLNQNAQFLKKIIAYYGGVESSAYSLKLLWDTLNAGTTIDFSGLYEECERLDLLPGQNNLSALFRSPYSDDKPYDFRVKLCFASVLLKKIYPAQANDGLVPVDSAKLETHALKKRVCFDGFDHEDMKSDRQNNPQLLSQLTQELIVIAKAYASRFLPAPRYLLLSQ